MAQQDIVIGTADEKAGDSLFSAFTKAQSNFNELYENNFTSSITVNQSNLSTTLGAAIDSTKVYVLDGIVDFTGTGLNIEVPAGGISIIGSTFDISGIKCTDDTYTLYTSPVGGSGNVLKSNFFEDISGSGSQNHNLTDATGFSAIEIVRINYNNCTSLGVVDGYRQGLESGTGRFGGTPELTLSGAWIGGYFIDTSIVRSLTNSAFYLFKAGVGFTMASRFRSNQNIDLPALAGFLDFSDSNFTNASTLQLKNCIITRDGVSDASDSNLTPNISAGDLSCDWSGNNGLSNTFVGGELTVTAEVETTIGSAGVFVDLAGTYTTSDLQHFNEPSNGQLGHLGGTPREFKVSGLITIDGGSNDVIALKIVIFRDATSTDEDGKTVTKTINNLQGGRDVADFTLSDNIILNVNDHVRIQVANISDTTNITAETSSFFNVETR